jgi:hypothetical protein
VSSQLAPEIVVAVSTGIGTVLGAGLTILYSSLTERRRMHETVFMRSLEDRKRLVEEILEASQSLAEYFNDHWQQIDELRPEDVDEPKERWRVMTRALRRGRIYFSPDTIALIVVEAQWWKKRLDLVNLPPERPLERFHKTVARGASPDRERMEVALRREVGEAEQGQSRRVFRWSSLKRRFTLRRRSIGSPDG